MRWTKITKEEMTPPPPPPPTDPDLAATLEDFKRGGWVVSLLGGAGMLARMLLTDEEHFFLVLLRKTIAGSIVGCIVYFAIHGQDISSFNKAMIMATSGAGSPEIMELIRKKYSKGFNNEKEPRKKRKRK